jgi:hypothetical protein
MISTLEAERNAIVEDQASTHPNAKKIQTLHKLKAIGPEFAAVLVGEIFHRDFNNRRQLASYVGYAPSPFQSGKLAHDQGISKAGNRKGRTTGIELAWLWLRYQPDSDLSVWFRTRVGVRKAASAVSPLWRWHASYSWRSGVTLKLAWCHKVPSSKGEKRGPIREDYEIQGGCVTVTKQGLKDAAEEKGPIPPWSPRPRKAHEGLWTGVEPGPI